MYSIAFLVTWAAVGVDYGWQPIEGGQLEYIIQIAPAELDAMKQGEEVVSEIHPDAQGVRRFRIRVGRGELPRLGTSPAPPALTTPGILNLPPPPSDLEDDGKDSVLVRPDHRAVAPASGLTIGEPEFPDRPQGMLAPPGGGTLNLPPPPVDDQGADQIPGNGPLLDPLGASGAAPAASSADPPSVFPAAPQDSGTPNREITPPSFPIPSPDPRGQTPTPVRGFGETGPATSLLEQTLARDRAKQPAAETPQPSELPAAGPDGGPGESIEPDRLLADGRGAAAQKPTLDEKTAQQLAELDQARPWLPLVLTSAALFASLAANFYLGWVALGIYRRYREIVVQLQQARQAVPA
jgi:hypothetical protein